MMNAEGHTKSQVMALPSAKGSSCGKIHEFFRIVFLPNFKISLKPQSIVSNSLEVIKNVFPKKSRKFCRWHFFPGRNFSGRHFFAKFWHAAADRAAERLNVSPRRKPGWRFIAGVKYGLRLNSLLGDYGPIRKSEVVFLSFRVCLTNVLILSIFPVFLWWMRRGTQSFRSWLSLLLG